MKILILEIIVVVLPLVIAVGGFVYYSWRDFK